MSKTIHILFSLWCSATFYLPPVYVFTDPVLLPKWYAFLLSAACLACWFNVALLCERVIPYRDLLTYFLMGFIFMSTLECLHVLVNIMVNGQRTGGETGTTGFPAELALNLCIAIPVAIHQARHNEKSLVKKLYIGAILLYVVTIFFTQSRTGGICLSLYFLMYAWGKIKRRFSGRRAKASISVLLAIVVLTSMIAYVVFCKENSTSGRKFILQRSIELAMEHPWVGHGHGGFEREYMLRQAKFFQRTHESQYALLADEMRHPLNEFVYLWVNYGIIAPIILLIMFMLPLWQWWRYSRNRGYASLLPCLIAVFVFSMFSYPSYYPITWLTLGTSLVYTFQTSLSRMKIHKTMHVILLAMSLAVIVFSLSDAIYENLWYRAYRHSFRSNSALVEYEQLHGYFRRNPHFLYNYAMASFKRGDLKKAEDLLEECGKYWNGYNRELLYGDVLLYQQNFTQAISHYQKARHMCPARFAPLEGIYKAYDELGDEEHRKQVAQQISEQKVKVNSPYVQRIKQQYR